MVVAAGGPPDPRPLGQGTQALPDRARATVGILPCRSLYSLFPQLRFLQLNGDGSVRPFRTEKLTACQNRYDAWLGLEPPVQHKHNWDVYI